MSDRIDSFGSLARFCATVLVTLAISALGGCTREKADSGDTALPTSSALQGLGSLALPAASSLAAAPRPRSAPSEGTTIRCDQLCDPVRQLGCSHSGECVSNCRQMLEVPYCQLELQSFFGCLSREPVAHWECLDDGTGAIRQGFCEAEQARFAACLDKKDVQ